MISRRRLIGGFTSAAVGGIGVGVVSARISNGSPSIRFIGHGDTIMALLDTGAERVLFVLGEPDDYLMANVAGIASVGHRRFDAVVATHRVLTSRVTADNEQIAAAHRIVLQMGSTIPPIPESTVVGESTEMALSHGVRVGINLVAASSAATDGDHPEFAIVVSRGGVSAAMVSSASVLQLAAIVPADVLVIPGMYPANSAVAQSLIVTTEPGIDADIPQILVQTSGPVAVNLGIESIEYRADQVWS